MTIKARNTGFEFAYASTVADPGAADADSSNILAFEAPFDCEIVSITHVPLAVWIAAAPANDATVTVKKNNGNSVASLAVQSALAAGSQNAMTMTSTLADKRLLKNDKLTIDTTANGTADAPLSQYIIRYKALPSASA